MRATIVSMFLSCIVGYSAGNQASHHENTTVVNDGGSAPLDCVRPSGYSVVEVEEPGTHNVNIVQGDKVIKAIKLPAGVERNGFGFNWAKKTKEGFEISVDYGSRYFYGKRFQFVCKQQKFYLSRIVVDSFDKAHPEKWSTKVVRVRPNLPLEKFVITDFMREGEVK